MKTMARYLESSIIRDLPGKMVFIGGPRQVGKTTFAKFLAHRHFSHTMYLNWDSRDDRRRMVQESFDTEAKLLIFDELHKYRPWKNYIKGIFDKRYDSTKILVTGSSRLDVYRRGGDSLAGRYHYYRLHPFSFAELAGFSFHGKPGKPLHFQIPKSKADIEALMHFGGFPEMVVRQSDRDLRRWHHERIDRLVREDIRDIEAIRDIGGLQILAELLAERAACQLSLNALREDLEVAYKTVKLWVDILERFYYHFRITPFSSRSIRSLRKEPKLYLWDWSEVQDEGRRFENMVASHLLKFTHFLEDTEGYRTGLHYLRDVDGREVDFLVTVDKKPWFAVEAKFSDKEPSRHLKYFQERLKIPFSYQVVHHSGVDIEQNGIRIISADRFLSGLV